MRTFSTGASAGPRTRTPSGAGFEKIAELGGKAQGFFLLFGSDENVGTGGEGRVAEVLAEFEFLLIEARVVLIGGVTNGVVIGIQGLDDDVAGSGSPPCPAGGLGE